MYQTIIFDLDGTVIDSGPGVTHAVQYSLNKMGITVEDAGSLKHFIGPPLYDSYQRYYGFDKAQQDRAIEYYREYYEEKGVHENSLYDGMEQVLSSLKKHHKFIALATSKPKNYAELILSELKIDSYFDLVCGASLDHSMREKIEILGDCIYKSGQEKAGMVMVGDRHFDVEGAQFHGIDSIGVLFGFGDLAEMQECRPTHIAPLPEDILNFVF